MIVGHSKTKNKTRTILRLKRATRIRTIKGYRLVATPRIQSANTIAVQR
jgi:hypothetical protein